MAATPQMIMDLNQKECEAVIEVLKPLDKNIDKRVAFVSANFNYSLQEALEYVVTENPVLWAKVYLNWEARDYQFPIIAEGKKSKKLVLRLGRRLGKCLTGDTLIHDGKNGQYYTIEELYKKQQANVFCLNESTMKLDSFHTDIVTNNGIKPVFKVTTASGREINATGNHPFYTLNGFVEVDDLKKDNYIAIAKNQIHTNPVKMPEEEIKFLAYMIGDGTTTNKGNLRFSCHKDNLHVLEEMQQICHLNNCKLFKYNSDKTCDWHIKGIKKSNCRHNFNKMVDLLLDHELIGKNAFTKAVPKKIFSLSNSDVALFLSRLYATDGWATSSYKNKGRIEIGYCSVSKKLCADIQSLLLRFGINSVLQEKQVNYNNTKRTAYTLGIYSVTDCLTFIKNIGIFSKEKALNQVENVINQMTNYGIKYPSEIKDILFKEMTKANISKQQLRNYAGVRFDTTYNSLSESKLKKANELIKSDVITKIIDADIIWDKIVSIEYIGQKQTYDFTVPEYHNFSSNDFITHNTDSMCVLTLWFAYTMYNKGQNNQYNILIMTPYETQIDLIFKRLKQLIEQSPVLKSLIKRDVVHEISFGINGTDSTILGLTAGASNSSGGGNNSRGQRADVIVLDEVDYIGSNQLTNIINIRNEAPERIRIICASTPCGKHEEYYRWCTGASKSYSIPQEDIDNFRFNGYDTKLREKGDGNGWTEIYAPSIVNKELLKINVETEQTYLQDIRDELSELRYEQEVMAEFGEEEMGVYQKRFIQAAIDEGNRIGHKYLTSLSADERQKYLEDTNANIRMLGVDWDKYAASTNMVCVEYDRYHQNEAGMIEPCFKVLFRVEIPRSDFTYINAINKIIELDKEYHFHHIAVDRGYGETQLELLHKYGIEHPESGMADKVKGYQFSEKIEVRDPYTKQIDNKPLKPFMVNNSVNVFEKQKIILAPEDKDMREQFEAYRVKSISSSGLPIYTDENEHAIDAVNLCLLIFEQKHGELLRKIFSKKIMFIGKNLDDRKTDVKERDIITQTNKLPTGTVYMSEVKNVDLSKGVIGVFVNERKTKKKSRFKRRTF